MSLTRSTCAHTHMEFYPRPELILSPSCFQCAVTFRMNPSISGTCQRGVRPCQSRASPGARDVGTLWTLASPAWGTLPGPQPPARGSPCSARSQLLPHRGGSPWREATVPGSGHPRRAGEKGAVDMGTQRDSAWYQLEGPSLDGTQRPASRIQL